MATQQNEIAKTDPSKTQKQLKTAVSILSPDSTWTAIFFC
jgi:hypothetical protein